MHRAVGAYEAPQGGDSDDEWDTDPGTFDLFLLLPAAAFVSLVKSVSASPAARNAPFVWFRSPQRRRAVSRLDFVVRCSPLRLACVASTRWPCAPHTLLCAPHTVRAHPRSALRKIIFLFFSLSLSFACDLACFDLLLAAALRALATTTHSARNDTRTRVQNTNNQENAKKQNLAAKQLGGVRTAAEAARMVRDRQVTADR